MFRNKKAIGPVVAVSLLVVVSVIAVLGFQNWFNSYSIDTLTDVELKSQNSVANVGIETLIGDQLYFKNTLNENISIKQIKIGNYECNISLNISFGVHNISLDDCLDDLILENSIDEIVIITDENVYSKKHLFDDIEISSSNSLVTNSGNYFGDGSDGDILVNLTGIYQDLGSGYQLHPETTGTEWNSIEDGDMVVINAQDFIVESGVEFSTTNRCRGLMIYSQGDTIINGTVSMTARGAYANPSNNSVDTPVPPSDGNIVPSEGLVIRRVKSNWSDIDATVISDANADSIDDFNGTHNSSDLFFGTGNDAVSSESNQVDVENGLVIKIPRVGGVGGAAVTANNGLTLGENGNNQTFSFGGGGSGAAHSNGFVTSGAGGDSTCFSGGTGGGGISTNGPAGTANSGNSFGGTGGNAYGSTNSAGGGAGNDGGTGAESYGLAGEDGTGGLLLIFVKENVNISSTGRIYSQGSQGGSAGEAWQYSLGGGGASGGGMILLLYSGNLNNEGIISTQGGIGGIGMAYDYFNDGGDGGGGSIIGPIKIDY